MKLDPRIKSVSDILTCFDIERAKAFIGENGFFANEINFFSPGALHCRYGTLTNVLVDDRFTSPYLKGSCNSYPFFLPESSLKPEENKPEGNKPEEKKYRPYTLMEFEDKFHIGLPIKFRKKGEKKDEWFSVLTGYWHHQIGDELITYIFIGVVQYTLDELFNEYEWQSHYTEDFQPFGVEE